MSKKYSYDIHGVIDAYPEFFAAIIAEQRLAGAEVHIVTGISMTDNLKKDLKRWGIQYTHFFSISDYHKEIGTAMTYKNGDKTQPLVDKSVWDRTKADYCSRVGIDQHTDDSLVYGQYFDGISTEYILFDSSAKTMHSI